MPLAYQLAGERTQQGPPKGFREQWIIGILKLEILWEYGNKFVNLGYKLINFVICALRDQSAK